MKYFIVAGEASGDLHASNLMQGIKQADSNADFRFFGGDLMAGQGGTLIKHYRDMAFMGFIEVLLNLRTIKANMELCKHSIAEYKPDVVNFWSITPVSTLELPNLQGNRGLRFSTI